MHRTTRRIIFSMGVALALAAVALADDAPSGAGAAAPATASADDGRAALLELAFDAASAIPAEPHIKDRARCQEAVVAACLACERPDLALGWAGRIETWRRGSAYADLASHCARHGMTADAERCVALASAAVESAEDWRKDRVKEKIARSSALLAEAKARDAGTAEPSAPAIDDETFGRRLAALADAARMNDFERLRGELDACVELHAALGGDAARRAALVAAIDRSWGTTPIALRVDVLARLAADAAGCGAIDEAADLADRAAALVDGATWRPEDRLPIDARIAQLRLRAGQGERARAALDAAVEAYGAARTTIVDIDRADVLRPLAEAAATIKGPEAAAALFRLAVDESMANPNGRPRAEDLCLTLCSMARAGCTPDAATWERVRGLVHGLGAPW